VRLIPPLLLALLLSGCAALGPGDGKPVVVAGTYPLAWLAERVGGPDVHVTNLVRPGTEPHDVELTPRQVGITQEAAVVLLLHGFQPAVDDAVGNGTQKLDLAPVARATGGDPHVWLDPVRMQAMAQAVADRLARRDPLHAAEYRTRAAGVVADLRALDQDFRAALRSCARTDIVTSHAAFGYLASRYGLVQRGITGFSPDAEPSPRRVAQIARFAKEHHVTTIFFEALVDPRLARTVASEVGARTAVLDPIESVRGGDDYLSVQRRNATALHDALGCA
jgi:zinc transport system substrate-binding protein